MKRLSCMLPKLLALVVVGVLLTSSMTFCLADAHSEYLSAYLNLTENGLIDANINVDLTMDGNTSNYSGNMKIDNNKDIMYYEMACNGKSIITFTDGAYLYTEVDGEKTKFTLNQNAGEGQPEPEAPQDQQSRPEFTVQDFINNFSSLLEPGKIAQLGLLSPVDKNYVVDTEKNGNEYTLNIADGLAQYFLNTVSENASADQEATVTFPSIKDFSYVATVENGVVTGVVYSGEMSVHVPGSLMSSDTDADYQLGFTINITFNNPGNEAEFELPSTDGFTETQPNGKR